MQDQRTHSYLGSAQGYVEVRMWFVTGGIGSLPHEELITRTLLRLMTGEESFLLLRRDIHDISFAGIEVIGHLL